MPSHIYSHECARVRIQAHRRICGVFNMIEILISTEPRLPFVKIKSQRDRRSSHCRKGGTEALSSSLYSRLSLPFLFKLKVRDLEKSYHRRCVHLLFLRVIHIKVYSFISLELSNSRIVLVKPQSNL
jgi:hypothetical protein